MKDQDEVMSVLLGRLLCYCSASIVPIFPQLIAFLHDTTSMIFLTAGVIALSTFACLVLLPPLALQVQGRNVPSSLLIFSTFMLIFFRLFNAIIWPTEDTSAWWDGRILCDIQIKLQVGLVQTISGATVCLFRQISLILISDNYAQQPSRAEKRRTMIIELVLCVILPLLKMTLVYVVQPDRYWIVAIHGCTQTVDTSWTSYVLVLTWPIIINLVGLVYAALASYRKWKRHCEASALLARGSSRMNSKNERMFRFTVSFFLIDFPVRLWGFISSTVSSIQLMQPYSWSRIHPEDWSAMVRRTPIITDALVQDTARCVSAIGIFVVLGFGRDAMVSYRGWLIQAKNWAPLLRLKGNRLSSKLTQLFTNSGVNRKSRSVAIAHELEAMQYNQQTRGFEPE